MTRGLLIIVKNKEIKLAAYSNSDSYLGGLGVDILNILKPDDALDKLCKNIDSVTMFTKKDIEEDCYEAAGGKQVYEQLPYDTKQLVQNAVLVGRKAFVGAADHALIEIMRGNPIIIQDSSEYAADSLFCEYGYVIDLDQMTFEVYKGFNQTELKEGERFKPFEKLSPDRDKKWYPIKLLKVYPLTELPEENEFLGVDEE